MQRPSATIRGEDLVSFVVWQSLGLHGVVEGQGWRGHSQHMKGPDPARDPAGRGESFIHVFTHLASV